MEEIQKIIESESFLSPRQIIEYIGEQFKIHNKYLSHEDFYDLLIGVFKKETKRISSEELSYQKAELAKNNIFLWPFNGEEGFIEHDYGMPNGRRARFYFNIHDKEGRKKILESIVSNFNMGYKIKTVGTAHDGFDRYDNTVMYVGREDSEKYIDFFKNLSLKHPECLDDEVPLLTRKVSKGIGYAVSTLKDRFSILDHRLNGENLSFSSMQSMLFQITFDKALKEEISSYDKITELYKQALKEVNFNPEKPYLRLGMKDPFKLIKV